MFNAVDTLFDGHARGGAASGASQSDLEKQNPWA